MTGIRALTGGSGPSGLSDEAYARAALSYLAEPADRALSQLLETRSAAEVLDAIKAGRPPRLIADARSVETRPRPRPAMERWRTRLPLLPSREEIAAFQDTGIRIVCPGDPEWPGQLADLGDEQPYLLWLRGNADLRFCCLRSVAIVGSRAATAYGSYVAAEFAASVAARGLAVVSGGAFGVDAAAHRGALGADGVTVAVLASGVDTPYPAAHTELFDAVAAQGVIVSEWPPGANVTRLRFLVRNRVIAALATGTLLVEAGQRSGALNTARHARDLHRSLMAVPGPVTSDQSAGCHQVIRDWQGTLVTSAADVIEQLSPLTAAPPPGPELLPPGSVPPDPAGPVTGAGPVVSRDQLGRDSARVLDALPRRGGLGTVRVAERAGLAPVTVAACLGRLAAAGFVERCADGWRLRREGSAPGG